MLMISNLNELILALAVLLVVFSIYLFRVVKLRYKHLASIRTNLRPLGVSLFAIVIYVLGSIVIVFVS